MVKFCKKCNTPISPITLECSCSQEVCRICRKNKKIPWSSCCHECDKLSTWDQLKIVINRFDNGEIIKRQSLLRDIGNYSQGTIDAYNHSLRRLGIIERTKPGKYLKHKDIPKSLSVPLMKKLLTNWKGWFIPLELLDELYGDKK